MKEEPESIAETLKTSLNEELDTILNCELFRTYSVRKDATSAENLFDINIEHDTTSIPVRSIYPDATKEMWLDALTKHKESLTKWYENNKGSSQIDIFFDDEIISLAKGFILGPVGTFRDKMVGAAHHEFDSLDDLKNSLKKITSIRDIVLYMTNIDNGKYVFRGDFVDKE